MTCKIENIDIGTVTLPELIVRRENVRQRSGVGLTYHRNLNSDSVRWRLTGRLSSPTKAQVQALLNLKHGLPVLVDLDDRFPGWITWGRVSEIAPRPSRVGGVFNYTLTVDQIPGIGSTYVQTDDVYLHDLNYRTSFKAFDPALAKFNLSVTSNRLDWTWESYVDNDKNSIQTAILEFQVGDDIDAFTIWGWKSGGWVLIGDWGDADTWGAGKAFVDNDSYSHTFKANYGSMGEDVTGIGTISRLSGFNRRVLLSITNLRAHSGNDMSTDYTGDQLLLKMTAEHNQRETLRPYPVVTYIDGSRDYGRA